MCEEKNKDKKGKEDQNSDEKTHIFLRCQKHNISYPSGSTCPECEKEQKK